MYIFIDESGIHKKVDHSTVVLVYLETQKVENVEQRVIILEKELGDSLIPLDEFWLKTRLGNSQKVY